MIQPATINDFAFMHFQPQGPLEFPAYFEGTLARLKVLYPKANLHLMTNLDEKVPGFIVHHRPDIPMDYQARFHLFDILDRPFMSLDMDIYLVRPFTSFQLSGRRPFKFFSWVAHWMDIDPPLPPAFHRHYNGGMIWFRKPNSQIGQELRELALRFPPAIFDDLVMSYYCFERGWVYRDDGQSNRLVFCDDRPDLSFQSLHFIGPDKSHLPPFLEAMKDAPRHIPSDYL